MTWPVVLLAASVAASDTSVRALTLTEAVEMAQRLAPQAVQAAGQVRNASAGVRSAYGAFLPSVSLSAGATRQYPSRGGGTRIENGQVITLAAQPWSYAGSLGANVDLFTGGQRLFDLQQAKQEAVAARANQVVQGFNVVLAVKQQFYNVLAARESEVAARAQLEQAEQQQRAANLRVRAKTSTRSDSLRSEIQVRDARLAVMDAHNTLAVANAGLARAVGVEARVTAAEEAPERPTLSVAEAPLRRLAGDGPAVQEARANLIGARAARRASWSSYLPSLGASYSRGASGTDDQFGLGANDYSYSGSFRLSLSLPVFDHFQRESQVVRAQVAEETAQASLRDARLAALEGLEQSLGAFRLAEQRVESKTASVAAAEEDLRVQQQRYAVGGSTLLDVLTSQTQLNQARQDLIRARYDQRVAKAELEALVGRNL